MKRALLTTAALLLTISCTSNERRTTTTETTSERTDLSGFGTAGTATPGPIGKDDTRDEKIRDTMMKGSTGNSSSFRRDASPTEPPYRANSDFLTTERP